MARMGRIVIPNIPHHIIQRGNRSQNVFFSKQDKEYYLDLLRNYAQEAGLSFWAYCLMDNHVHLVAVPQRENSLAKGIGKAHKHYTRMVNFREKWRGYLWQGRFSSFPLDETYLYAAVRYVERNPVRAGLVKRAEDYPYSSAKAHIYKKKDILLSDNFMLSEIKDWAFYLAENEKETDLNLFKKHAKIGRPLGDNTFISKLEKITGRFLRKKKPGPKNN
ncbi:MAG: transposase [Candidatus Omnitrophota bacterium]|nr:MAG: transposase [Candidatus Omnitrophota bacterium]